MLAIKIDNPIIENRLKEFAKESKKAVNELTSEALKIYLDIYKNDKLPFAKQDPMQNLHEITYEDDGEDLSDVKLYTHVDNSADYIHKLRRKTR